jgi:galactose oxidase-like protein
VTRKAAWIAAALTLALSATAMAHTRTAGEPGAGMEHSRADAAIWKAQASAEQRWHRLTRSERRLQLRRSRRGARRAYARAHAAAGDPREVGSWAPPFVMTTDYTGYAVHAALLHTGEVLMWGREGTARGHKTYAWLWDAAEGDGPDAMREVTPKGASGDNIPIFCSGMSFLPDGRLLVVGGTLARASDDPTDLYQDWAGLNAAVVFDPDTETWTELPRPAGSRGRWYPTQVLLPDGRTLVMGGYTDEVPGAVVNLTQEIYDPATNGFRLLDGPLQLRLLDLYPHLFTMPDGKVLVAGPSRGDSALFDPLNLADPWTNLPPLDRQRVGGNAVLLPEGPAGSTRVATIGGKRWGELPIRTGKTIDLDNQAPVWSPFPALDTPRWSANTVLLPDRSMVTVGGDDGVEGGAEPERAVELYDPVTRNWRTGPSQAEIRGYHSTALLLPDGRVLSTGDEQHPKPETSTWDESPDETGEIYSPPYLFRGPRPVITSAPSAVRWDVPFAVGAEGDIDDAVLIAPSAVTHANDMTQRLVPLAKVAEYPGGVTLRSPSSAYIAQPGWYMLFLLDDGVPSVAKWVKLDPTAVDAAGPAVRLGFAKRNWLQRVRRTGRLRVQLRMDEPAAVDVRLQHHGRSIAHAAVETGKRRLTIELRPRRSALRWLRNAHAPRLRFSVVAVDAAENDTVWSRLLKPALRN